jgi:peptide/nickel transport system ATP-binding protein
MQLVQPLEIRGLSVDYPMYGTCVHAVQDVSLRMDKNEILGVIGESGSGKSTLGAAILKLLPPPGTIVSGEILVDGINVLGLTESQLNEVRGSKVTYVPQGAQNALNPVFTVETQIADPIRFHKKVSWKEARVKAQEALALVNIPKDRSNQYPHQYSGGMKQRALIALALALGSKVVILDEPTTALDVLVQKQIFELVDSVRREFGTSFLLISHDLAVVSSVCDRIAIMYAGKIVEVAPTRKIFESPQHPYTRALIESIPRIRFSHEELLPIRGTPPNLAEIPSGCSFHPRCKYAIELCSELVPELREISGDTFASCHRIGKLDD